MRTFADVINLWPSAADLAEDLTILGVPTKKVTARAWRKNGIPGAYWDHVCKAAKRRGFRGVTRTLLCRLGRAPSNKEQATHD